MPDVGDRYACGLVERRLERKQREHAVDRAPDRAQPLAPPRPHGRTHEMDGADAPALEPPLEAEIEVRRVDADEHRYARCDETAADLTAQHDQGRQVCNDFGK